MDAVLCRIVSHSISLYPHISLSDVHRNESLACFKISGFPDTISIGSLVEIVPVTLLLPCVMESLYLWISRTSPFTCFNNSQMM